MNENPIEPTTAPANDEAVNSDAPVTDVNTATEAVTAEAQAAEPAPEAEPTTATPETPVADVKLVKVKVIAPFYDMEAEVDRSAGDKFEVPINRAEALVRADVAKLVKR